jgi:hypothetical protein
MDWRSVVGAVEAGTRLYHQYDDDDDDDDDPIIVYISCYELLKFLTTFNFIKFFNSKPHGVCNKRSQHTA